MQHTMILLLIVVIVFVAFTGPKFISQYNNLVTLQQKTNQAFADIDVLLRRRRDLIPSLVETVKGYASHESATLLSAIQARSSAAGGSMPNAQSDSEAIITAGLGRIFALAEAYPDLKANTNFISLQEQISQIEMRLSGTRHQYNASIAEYNSMTRTFPAVLVANIFGFRSREYFVLGADDRASSDISPTIKF